MLDTIGIYSNIYVVSRKINGNPNYVITIGRINNILKLYKLMYRKGVNLFLTRKKERLDTIYNEYKNCYS